VPVAVVFAGRQTQRWHTNWDATRQTSAVARPLAQILVGQRHENKNGTRKDSAARRVRRKQNQFRQSIEDK
jgi:putative NIF3 family GTP cyclohydrolase 1 type 2